MARSFSNRVFCSALSLLSNQTHRVHSRPCKDVRADVCGRRRVRTCLSARPFACRNNCMHARASASARTHARACKCARAFVRGCACSCTRVHVHKCVPAGGHEHVRERVDACVCACVCVCVYVCASVYVCFLSRANGTQMTTSNLACKPKGKRKNTKNRGQLNSNPGWPAKAPFESIRTVTWVRRLLQASTTPSAQSTCVSSERATTTSLRCLRCPHDHVQPRRVLLETASALPHCARDAMGCVDMI